MKHAKETASAACERGDKKGEAFFLAVGMKIEEFYGR
jgi:hypothetical protein